MDDLACDYIKIVYKGTEKVFPIYTMIEKEFSALGPDSKCIFYVKFYFILNLFFWNNVNLTLFKKDF